MFKVSISYREVYNTRKEVDYLFQPLKKRQTLINKQIKKLEKELPKLPEGQLVCYPNGIYTKWYQKTKTGLKSIPKKERDFATKLAYKQYLLARIHDLAEEQSILSKLDQKNNSSEKIQEFTQAELLLNNPHYSTLLTDYLTSQKSKWTSWMEEDYPTNPKNPEQKNTPTLNGLFVRSKSEAAIVRLLVTNHIPFRYEPALELEGMIIYPDFLIIHPKTEEVFIWEHFGMMDKPDYVHKTIKKIELYCNAGYRPDEKLILSFESKSNPFTYEKAEEIAWKYIL